MIKAVINGRIVLPERIIDGNILISGERIVAAGAVDVPYNAEIIDAKGLYVGPGFVDEHCHGYNRNGCLISVDDDPEAVAREHLRYGTTTLIASSDYSTSKETHLKMVLNCIQVLESGKKTSLSGIHLEGPYINRRYGSNADCGMDYDDAFCEELFSLVAPYARQCTYAPEEPCAQEVEKKLIKYHITPAIGHTCASPRQIERAVAYGAKIATHLFDANGCTADVEASAARTGHPQECTADALLAIPGLYYELICDSQEMHVTKTNVNLAYRAAGEDRIILISDAFADPTPQKNDLDVMYDQNGTLSGSRLCIAIAAQNFIKFTSADIRIVFKCASTNPAKAMGLYHEVGSLEAGKLADLVFVDPEFRLKSVIFRGEKIQNAYIA